MWFKHFNSFANIKSALPLYFTWPWTVIADPLVSCRYGNEDKQWIHKCCRCFSVSRPWTEPSAAAGGPSSPTSTVSRSLLWNQRHRGQLHHQRRSSRSTQPQCWLSFSREKKNVWTIKQKFALDNPANVIWPLSSVETFYTSMMPSSSSWWVIIIIYFSNKCNLDNFIWK